MFVLFILFHINGWATEASANSSQTFLYVGNSQDYHISVINTETNSVVREISEYIYAPEKLFVTPDKKNAYAISSGTFGRKVTGIDTSTHTVRTPWIIGGANDMVFSTNSQVAFLSHLYGDSVHLIFTDNNEVHSTAWELDTPASAMSVRPDGGYVYVDNFYDRDSKIWAYDMSAGVFTKTPLPDVDTSYSYHHVSNIGQSPTKYEMYITSNSWLDSPGCSLCDAGNNGFFHVYDTLTNKFIFSIRIAGSRFGKIEISSDGEIACINDPIYNRLYIFDLNNYSYRVVELDGKSQKLIIANDNVTAYLLQHDLNKIEIVDIQSATVTGSIPVGNGPYDMVMLPKVHRLYVTNELDNTVSVVDLTTKSVINTIPVGAAPKPIVVIPPTNNSPTAMAGENQSVTSNDQVSKIIEGRAFDEDGDNLLYRWIEGNTELIPWRAVGINGEANLALAELSWFSVGQHTLKLEVDDGSEIRSDDMILAVENSAPNAAATGGGVYEIFSPVFLGGEVSDFDGDTLSYNWSDGVNLLQSGEINSIYGGDPVKLPSYTIENLPLGSHIFFLTVDDGINEIIAQSSVNVDVVDNTKPTISPVPESTILWPPNHKMVDMVIKMNANDNSGEPVNISATITSNEPEDGLGDGDTGPDWTDASYNPETDELSFQLRAERSGSGEGRIYTVHATVIDLYGNLSSTDIEFLVPHDKQKK